MTRKTGPNGLALIPHVEGTVLHVYLDGNGHPTCGTGHLVLASDNLKVGDTISPEQNLAFLKHDLGGAEAAVNSCGLDLTQNQFDALVDFTFQEGAGALRELVDDAHRIPANIPSLFSHWTRMGAQHPRGIKIRRMLDRLLFETPDDVPLAPDWLTSCDHVE